MPNEYLEHANITVTYLDGAVRFLAAALPAWQVRGSGRMDWFGKPIDWVHVGSDDFYIALQGGGEGERGDWKGHAVGIKHLGLVVPDLAAVVDRLERAGRPIDHWGGKTAHRNSVYFLVGEDFQVEFVQYSSALPAERNTYPA